MITRNNEFYVINLMVWEGGCWSVLECVYCALCLQAASDDGLECVGSPIYGKNLNSNRSQKFEN